MAARTLTYTANLGSNGLNGNVKAVHVGTNVIPFDFNSGTTKFGTLSDVLLLGKVPNGALITQKSVRFGANANAAEHFALVLLVPEAGGTLSAYATLVASMTGSATAQVFNDVIPYKLSLSDDRAVQYAILALNCTTGGSETVSFSLQGFVEYYVDGSTV